MRVCKKCLLYVNYIFVVALDTFEDGGRRTGHNGFDRLNGLVVRAIEDTDTKAVILRESKGKSR